MVNTLQDIRDNKKLPLMGLPPNLLQLSTENLNFTDIIERIEKTIPHYYTVKQLIEDVVTGNLVLLYNSFYVKTMTFYARFYQDALFVSDSKYIPDYSALFVRKDQTNQ